MIKKSFIIQVTILLVMAFLTPSLANGQTTSHYGANVGDSGANLVGFDLTMYAPIDQKVYSKTMPLDFNIHWIVGVYPFFNWTFAGIYTYSVDNMSPIVIESNQTSDEKYDAKTDFKYNPSFSYILDISSLTNGAHQIVVSAGMYYNNNGHLMDDIFNETSFPIYFQVQNSMPVSTPTSIQNPTPTLIPELPTSLIISFLIMSTVALAIVSMRKHLTGS